MSNSKYAESSPIERALTDLVSARNNLQRSGMTPLANVAAVRAISRAERSVARLLSRIYAAKWAQIAQAKAQAKAEVAHAKVKAINVRKQESK